MSTDHQTTDNSRKEWLYALAASRLTTGQCRGERPDLLEIDQWRTGKLSESRAMEVLSYIAHDEQCYAQWNELCEEQRWLDANTTSGQGEDQPAPSSTNVSKLPSKQGWLGNVAARLSVLAKPKWGGAVAAAMLVVAMLPSALRFGDASVFDTYTEQLALAGDLHSADFPPVLRRMTKQIQSLDSTSIDLNKRQFQFGLRDAADQVTGLVDARWMAWKNSLPSGMPCNSDTQAGCSADALRNKALGSWSLVTSLACHSASTDDKHWVQQAQALKHIVGDDWPSTHFMAARLKAPLPKKRAALCETANGLLGQGG